MTAPLNFTASSLDQALAGPDTTVLQFVGPTGELMLELPLEILQQLIIVLPRVVQQMLEQP